MRNLRTRVLFISVLLSSLSASAQRQPVPVNQPDYNKSTLFTALPEKITIATNSLATALKTTTGNTVSITLSDEPVFRFEGQVVSTVSKYENKIQSVVIRSSNFDGATLTISRITNDDGTQSYTGRIISFGHGDLYELQTSGGQLILVKKKLNDLVNE